MDELEKLKALLEAIRQNDSEYETRYGLIIQAIAQAHAMGLRVGFRVDPKWQDDASLLEWPVAFIELPTGQVTWHMPQHEMSWDGHTNEEKYRRIQAFVEGLPQ